MKTFAEEQQYLRKKFYYDKEHAHGLIEFYNEMTLLIHKNNERYEQKYLDLINESEELHDSLLTNEDIPF